MSGHSAMAARHWIIDDVALSVDESVAEIASRTTPGRGGGPGAACPH
jgi:hypothetical protein